MEKKYHKVREDFVSKVKIYKQELHWVPLTTSSVITRTRLERADFFTSKSLTAVFKFLLHLFIRCKRDPVYLHSIQSILLSELLLNSFVCVTLSIMSIVTLTSAQQNGPIPFHFVTMNTMLNPNIDANFESILVKVR